MREDQLIVSFVFFAYPEYPLRMLFHVFNIFLRMLVLLLSKGNSECGVDCWHIVTVLNVHFT